MKKILFFILVLVLTVSSCNLFVNEEYGELILSFDGTLPDGARALDSNGLPVLSSTNMKIKIVRENGYTIIRELAAEESKSLIELVPIGEKIEITVTASNASSQWSGKKTHTVTSGRNQVIVLLSKKASGLNKLLFTQKKTVSAYGDVNYDLTLYMDGKPITVPQSTAEGHIFARDSLGRVYVRYKAGDTYVVRYTSEGDVNAYNALSLDFLANDYTTGKMYGLSVHDLKEIDEDLNYTSGYPPPVVISVPFAADKGIFTWADLGSSMIYLWKSGMVAATSGVFHTQADTYHLNDNAGFKVKDIFIRGSYVYVLFAGVNDTISPTNANIYSFGAVLKWKIGTNPNGGPRFEGNPEIIGMEANRVFADGVLQNYDYSKNFYGAVKVIGFDEDNIYIADDGFDAADTPAGARIVKNRNRIGVLNMNTNALTFTDAYPAKWYTEWKEWRTPNTKTIVWKRNGPGFEYYQIDRGDEVLSGDKKFTGSNIYKDVFCYDLDGNLYIVKNDGKISMYPQVEGAYSGNLQYTTNDAFSNLKPESGMAVDSSASDGYKYL
ncbi:hypothetical protein [Treponema sp. OMZ 799]|uniref:hypothetical protein n=1 Tax=Treponema sp. OMZ 799 TaxID=2563668 RepID=UPI0020A488EE|nr:hypothetical protein [Treponema sp. OMZ 799]